jgi:hypothetical protein
VHDGGSARAGRKSHGSRSPDTAPSPSGAWSTKPVNNRRGSPSSQQQSSFEDERTAGASAAEAEGTGIAGPSVADAPVESAADGAGASASGQNAPTPADATGAAALDESRESMLADISDACSEDVSPGASRQPAGDIVRGGEVGPDHTPTPVAGAVLLHQACSTWLRLALVIAFFSASA